MAGPGEARRIGIVGAGNISRLHLAGIARHPDRAVAAALADPDGETLAARAEEFGVAETYTDLGDMLARARLDAAIVCTPTHVRREVLLPLLEAGVPVLCEKPFAETYAEAAEVERASRQAGVPVAVNQNFRRHFGFALARGILEAGEIGEPLHMVHLAQHLRRDRGWRLERTRYVMAVMSIHWFDGYRWMLRDEPESVYASGVNSPATEGGRRGRACKDTAVSVVLRFRRGTVVSLSESFSSFARAGACALDCERGGIVMGYKSVTEVRGDGERVEHANPFDKAEATWFVLDDLLECVESREGDEGDEGDGRREPETAAADNLKSMRVLEAAYLSMAEGRAVRLDEIER